MSLPSLKNLLETMPLGLGRQMMGGGGEEEQPQPEKQSKKIQTKKGKTEDDVDLDSPEFAHIVKNPHTASVMGKKLKDEFVNGFKKSFQGKSNDEKNSYLVELAMESLDQAEFRSFLQDVVDFAKQQGIK